MDHYQLLFFVRRDGKDEIEIIDSKHKRKFLSRVHVPGLKLADILVGGKVTIFSRQYRVADFEDEHTRRALGKSKTPAFAMLRHIEALGTVWTNIEGAGLRVLNARMVRLSPAEAASVASGCDASVGAGAALALELQGEEPAARMQALRSHLQEEGSLAAGAMAVALSEHESRLLEAFFSRDSSRRMDCANEATAAMSGDCAVVMVLPTAVAKGLAGRILSDLMGSLSSSGKGSAGGAAAGGAGGRGAEPLAVSALCMHDLDRRCADEFLEVYRLVVPDFGELAAEYCSGPCIALEVTGPDAVERLRAIVGPRDIDVAKRVRPHTLRARYGFSSASPAIHVTDLPEDGPLESEYLFLLLQQAAE